MKVKVITGLNYSDFESRMNKFINDYSVKVLEIKTHLSNTAAALVAVIIYEELG